MTLQIYLERYLSKLGTLDPRPWLKQGWTRLYSRQGQAVKSIKELKQGDHLEAQLIDGRIALEVKQEKNKMDQSDLMESQTFNKMVARIESIIGNISKENIDLDEVLSQTEEGYKILKSMKLKLEDAKLKIEQLKKEYQPGAEG